MENILREYLQKSFPDEEKINPCGNGPVVTISREFGCPSKLIAQLLSETINHRYKETHKPWKYINKEIVESAAKELELNPNEINFMLSSGARGILSDVLASFAYSYVSNHRMKKTIVKVVSELAQKGRFVIVGRGGAGVLQGCGNTIHVRLQAPLEWRIAEISNSRGLKREEALKLIQETDEKRKSLIELVSGQKFNPYLFDLTFNCQTMTKQEVVETIIGSMLAKNMLP